MSGYPRHLVQRRTLPDGRSVILRPIRPDDAEAEREFLQALSEKSRRLRFQRYVEAPSEELIHFHTRIDYRRHMAFVCEVEREGRRQLVGEARYVGNPDGRSCELGIVVADEWHHTGVAQLLMEALMRAARSNGYETMAGLVLSENKDMLDFARALGFQEEPMPHEPGRVRVARKL